MTKFKYYVRPARSNQNWLDNSGWDIQDFHGEVIARFQTRDEAHATAQRYVAIRRSAIRIADWRIANLQSANLQYANLQSADLQYAKNSELAIAMTRILPDGDLVGWKKCTNNIIVKLLIPYAAKRSHAFGRKCRAEYVQVIEVFGGDVGIAQHDSKTEYRAGAIIKPDSFNEDWTEECSNGIHFFISRVEAENY
jgi:hypothetical protein